MIRGLFSRTKHLAGCALLCASFSAPAAFGAVDAGLVSLLPAGTQMVFNVDVQESRNSQFGRFLLKDTRWSDEHLQQVMTTTGFDPRRDLVSFIVAAPAPKPNGTRHDNFLVLARGSFDREKIGAAAVQHGWTRQNLAGTTAYAETSETGTPHGFAFLDVDVAAMGDLATLKNVAANRTASSTIDPELDRLMKTVSGNHDVWFASIGSPARLAAAIDSKDAANAGMLRAITQSSGGIKFGNDVEFSFDALIATEKDATSLADVVRFLASAAQMKRDNDPNAAFLAPALDNLKLTSTGNAVHVTTSMPEETLEAMATQMHNNHQRPSRLRN